MIGMVKMFDGNYGGKFEVFNPYNQRVCEMPDLIGDEQIFGYFFFLFLNHKLFYNVKFKGQWMHIGILGQCAEISCVTGGNVRDGWVVRLSQLR